MARTRLSFHRESIEFARACTFFDAVYAFAITLLVVNIDPPPAEFWHSLPDLFSSGLGYQIFGFLVSFVVIAVFWRLNHRMLSGFEWLSPKTIVANLVAIAFLIFIPFSTQTISDPETADLPLAIAFYAVTVSLAVLSQAAIYQVARLDGVLRNPLPARANAMRLIDTLTTPAVFLLSIPIAYTAGTDWARWSWCALIVIGPISGTTTDRAIAKIRAEQHPEKPPPPDRHMPAPPRPPGSTL